MLNAFPLDMSQYGSLFNSTRLPRVGKDELISYNDASITNHILVLHRGHAYKLRCINDEGVIAILVCGSNGYVCWLLRQPIISCTIETRTARNRF